MKVEYGKIVEATEAELFSRYLRAGMDDIMDSYTYMSICEAHGTTIKKDFGTTKVKNAKLEERD